MPVALIELPVILTPLGAYTAAKAYVDSITAAARFGSALTLTAETAAGDPGATKLCAPLIRSAARGLGVCYENGGSEQRRLESVTTIRTYVWAEALADDGILVLPSPPNLGRLVVTCYDEELVATVKSDGTCTKLAGTMNTDVSDTDGHLDLFSSDGEPRIKNRLGGSRMVRVVYDLC